MMPDEVRRLPKNKAILLIRGSKPLMLNKITPDEHPYFNELKPCKAADHIPEWKKRENERPSGATGAQSYNPPPPPTYQMRFDTLEDDVSEEYVPEELENEQPFKLKTKRRIRNKSLTETPPKEI